MRIHRLFSCLAIAGAATVLAFPASAQTSSGSTTPTGPTRYLPGTGTGTGYLGLNIGRSKYHASCGHDVLSNLELECGLNDTAVHLYAGAGLGGMGGMPGIIGGEIGYVNMGHITRGGGDTRAQGVNLSVVARAPVGAGFGVFGKLGTTYGWTKTSTSANSSVASGKENGFGFAYGVGASYDFTPNLSAVLAWDSHDFHFAGSGRDAVRVTSLGLMYRY